jgi:hypothetical protein
MIRQALVIAAACVPLCASAQHDKQFSTESVKKATATVESVDRDTRTLVMRDSDDTRTVLVAGPEVRNFDQIEPGDELVATYREALLAEVKPKGTGVQGVQGAAASTRAEEGQRPAGGVGATVATTVVIESVDKSFDTVTFKRSDGIVRTVAVEDPKAVEFVQRLRPGDEVQVTYTEAVAVALVPAQ